MAARCGRFYRIVVDGGVATVAEPKRKATHDDVLAAPEHQVAEILDGELFLSPRPANPYALASFQLGLAIGGGFSREPHGAGRPGGWWILSEPELHLGSDVVVPDLAGWRCERLPRVPNEPYFEFAPDWLCETLSPSTARIARTRNLALCARARAHITCGSSTRWRARSSCSRSKAAGG